MIKKIVSLFKRSKEEEIEVEVELNDYLASIFTKDEEVYYILGYYESGQKLAEHLREFMNNGTVFTGYTVNGDVVVLRGKDVQSVRVDRKPYKKLGEKE